MLKKFLSYTILVTFILINLYAPISYSAYVPVTEQNLNEALQNFISTNSVEEEYEIEMSDGKMKITAEDKTYTLDYDLTNDPTFTISVPIQNGMSYSDFQEQTENLYLPMFGYIGVANVQGVSFEDASTYIGMCMLMNSLSDTSSDSSKYVIVKDETTIEDENAKVIHESEFGDHVMEYVNSIYSDKKSFSDNTEQSDLNTFTWTTEQTDATENSCNLVSTLTVNPDADFSKMIGYQDSIDPNSGITEETADYVVKLKVGQECQIQSSERITGYSFSGTSCAEFNDDNTVIKAVKVGIKKGYIYLGDLDNKKSIYISVEENATGETLDPIILKIGKTSDNDDKSDISKNEASKDSEKTNNENNRNSSTAKRILPKTGTNTKIILFIGGFILIAIIFRVKVQKYKKIN